MKMKNLLYLFTTCLLVFSSCTKDKCEKTITYETQVPIYQSWEELRVPIEAQSPRTLINMGKIYFKNSYILINEINEGIHVVNNADPTNPTKVSFIPIPGNKDMAIKDNLLYADSYTDLVVIDVADVENAKEVGRTENLYPEWSWFMGLETHAENGVIIGYESQIVTEVVDCSNSWGGWYEDDLVLVDSSVGNQSGGFSGGETAGITGAGSGTGGSFARFTIKNNHLYAVSDSELISVDISEGNSPQIANRTPVGWNIETIFPYNESLFMGSQAGMFIYSIANPSNPDYTSDFEHARACDPVVVDEDIAYVTLRDGNECAGFVNQLDVINVESLQNPWLIQSKPMHHPMGLGVDNGVLFICDDDEGLKIFDCSNPEAEFEMLAHYPEYQAYDVISYLGMLIMIGSDGLYIYNYKNSNDITLMGSIEKGS